MSFPFHAVKCSAFSWPQWPRRSSAENEFLIFLFFCFKRSKVFTAAARNVSKRTETVGKIVSQEIQ